MSVLEGGIYFEELTGLPPVHLALLVAGLVLALLGAIWMGVAGYISGERGVWCSVCGGGGSGAIWMGVAGYSSGAVAVWVLVAVQIACV